MNVSISDRWNGYLDGFPPGKKDVYYTEGYVKLYGNSENTALCVICEEGRNILLMPFLRGKISGFYDFETAYGYGGSTANTDDQEWIGRALAAMCGYFQGEKYLCGFIRFHPLLGNGVYCRDRTDGLDVVLDRHTVSVDLRQKEEDIWKTQISSKNRNMIRKAEKYGLEYCAEDNFGSMKDFVALYNGTMERLAADSFYYFNDSYYMGYIREMAGRGFLGIVRIRGAVAAAALFMYSGRYGHYHLAGSDRGYGSYGVNNFLLWNTARELKKRHVEEFHLGGGTRASPDDSLFKFKRSFSKNEKDFYVGRCIFDRGAYEGVCSEWERKHPGLVPVYGNRLLKYRYKEERL